jgi:copper resistance protein B
MRIITRAIAMVLLGVGPAAAMDDGASFWRVDALVERRAASIAPDTAWQSSAWMGGDIDRIRLETAGVLGDDGRIDNEGGTVGIDNRLFYTHMIAPFWDAKAGLQFALFDRGEKRAAFMAGVEGLAPQGIRVDAVAGVSQTGVVTARLEASYDILFTQKLVAQPYVEAVAASGDDAPIGLGSGLSRIEGGLRLRYEIEKEVAPFIGVSFEQFTGATAAYVAADGGQTSKLRLLAGLKLWF